MLEAFKKMSSDGAEHVKEQADQLQALINRSREERSALGAMLTEIEPDAAKPSQVGKALQQVSERTMWLTTKLEELTARLLGLESRTTGFEQIETRIRSLVDSVAQAECTADKLLKPDGELQTHRQAVQQLSLELIQTTGNLALKVEALKKEETALDQLHERVRQAQSELKESVDRTAALKNDFDQLSPVTTQLQQEHNRMRDTLAQTREDAVRTEERLAALNSLAEHVLEKVKVLEDQKHTVEHAVVESNRLSEMVWNMDVQQFAGHLQFVEKIDARLNGLDVLSAAVDKKLDEQLARRAEVESLKSLCDGLNLQISDVQQKLDVASGLQQKSLPLTAQVATLKMQPDKTAPADQMEQQDEVQMAAQQKRLGELMDARRALAAAVDERLTEVHSLAGELGRRTARKDELVQELARLQGRQRDVATQTVIDHVVESMARLGEITQTTQATLKGLETERDLAERIEENIKQLRAQAASASSERLA
jgi:chromosome segregation ATPase